MHEGSVQREIPNLTLLMCKWVSFNFKQRSTRISLSIALRCDSHPQRIKGNREFKDYKTPSATILFYHQSPLSNYYITTSVKLHHTPPSIIIRHHSASQLALRSNQQHNVCGNYIHIIAYIKLHGKLRSYISSIEIKSTIIINLMINRYNYSSL